MIRHGFDPILECSSKNPDGNKAFSAFYARLNAYNGKSIEEIYQAAKVFEDGSTNLSTKAAKGRKAVNMQEVSALYSQLWDLYFQENPELLKVIRQYNGFSDVFGKAGSNCQATEIYRIWVEDALRKMYTNQTQWYHLMANIGNGDPYDVYCGRGNGSSWGNRYSHLPNIKGTLKVDTVEQAVAHHRFDFIKSLENPAFLAKVKELKGKRLGCFCKGKHLCHTIVIVTMANL